MARPILVEILGDATQFQRELDKAAGSTRRFGAVAKVAGGLLATGLAIGLEKSVKAAIAAEASHARLERAFKNVGLSAVGYKKQIDAAEAAGRKLGFTDESVSGSLGSLISATHNVSAALGDLSVAQDLARFKHVDLEQATKMLTMAMTGSQRAVKQLGITISPVTAATDALRRSDMDLTTEAGRAALAHAQLVDKMATGQAVIAATSALVKGQGQAYSETVAGGMEQFRAQLTHLEVQVGTLLLPVLTRLLDEANQLAAQFNANFGPAIRVVSAAFDRLHGATVLYHTLFLPIREMLIIWRAEFTAVEAIVRGVTAAVNACRAAASAIAAFFTNIFHAAISLVHGAISGLESALNGAKAALNAVLSSARSVAAFVAGGLTTAFKGFDGVGHAITAVIHAVEVALNAAAGAARGLAFALSQIHVPSIHLPDIHIPHVGLPGRRAAGGPVSQGKPYVVGERGPEMFIPNTPGTIIPNASLPTLIDGMTLAQLREYLGGWPTKWANDKQIASLDAPFRKRFVSWLTVLKKGVDVMRAGWSSGGSAYFGGKPMPSYFVEPGAGDFTNVSATSTGPIISPSKRLTNFDGDTILDLARGQAGAKDVVTHEWAHAFQKAFVLEGSHMGGRTLYEGAAEAFARMAAPLIFGGASTPLGKDLPGGRYGKPEYDEFAKNVLSYFGPDWVLGYQFQVGKFDKGGWLMPGLTMAMNRTGRPEPVGAAINGGGVTNNFYFPNYVGSPEELMSTVRQEFARLKNRNVDLGLA